MGVLEMIKKNRTRPSLIICTNLIQACLKSKRMDYLRKILQDFDTDQIRGEYFLIHLIYYFKVTRYSIRN